MGQCKELNLGQHHHTKIQDSEDTMLYHCGLNMSCVPLFGEEKLGGTSSLTKRIGTGHLESWALSGYNTGKLNHISQHLVIRKDKIAEIHPNRIYWCLGLRTVCPTQWMLCMILVWDLLLFCGEVNVGLELDEAHERKCILPSNWFPSWRVMTTIRRQSTPWVTSYYIIQVNKYIIIIIKTFHDLSFIL